MINDFKEFEMHDLIQKTLKEGLTEPEKQKYLEDIVVKLNKFLPDDFSFLGKMKDTYPTLVTTLEILSKESQLIKISEIEWLDLNKHLLMLYMYTLDYSKAEKLIDEVDNEIQRIRISFDSPKKKSIYATYLIYKSLYCDIAYKCDQGVVYLKEALNLVKDLQSSYPNLLYKIYQDYSDAEAFRGNITFAEELLVEAEKISNQIANLSSPERGFLFFIKAKIALYKGDYQDAILFVNKSIEAQSAQKFSALQVKCLALFQLGVIDEAEQLLSGLREELETMAIDHNHEIYGRFYEMMSRSRLSKGDLESAEKYINLSMERLADSASSYAIKGDIEYAKEEYKSALDNYLKALEIYKSRYGQNMQLDHISELYYHIVKAAKQLKHSQHVQKYVHAHDNIFGLKHRRTKELYDLLIHSQLDGSV